MEHRTIIIKRYANRKLYDTDRSRYVTLAGIARMVRDGTDVTIVDHSSGEDITRQTLSQIIFESEKDDGSIATPTLKDLIRTRGGAIGDYIQQTVSRGVSSMASIREEAERKIERLQSRTDLTLDEFRGSLREIFRSYQSGVEELQASLDGHLKRALGQVAGLGAVQREIDGWKRRLRNLEARIEKLERKAGGDDDA